MGYGWEGELVRLVPLDEAKHFDNIVRWLQDPELTATLGYNDYPMTREAEREWWSVNAKGRETDIIFAIETLDGVHIGQSGIHSISHMHKTATTGSFIGEEAYRGKGYGTDAARVRTRYCFEVLGLRQVYSDYFEGNEASRRMSEKIGAKVWGIKPNAMWKRGRYVSEVMVYTTPDLFAEAVARGRD
jgi:RimJ/RimL family protein N-acetyltransferase